MKSKKTTDGNNFYLSILNELKTSTNLTNIQKKLNISKQNLRYYLTELKKNGYIEKKGRGWYEPTERSKNLTKYDKILSKDISRGHAYVWTIKIPSKINNWDKRLEVLQKNQVHFKLVGALKTTPSIKVLGRRVWLCNNHLRIFDKPKASYYGETAKESRNTAFNEVLLIVETLNNKLGINLKPEHIFFRKEHYALIKNDLAIEHNRKGELVHILDNEGEWLLIDDSLGEGGELENVGKKAYKTNIPMQRWWNDNKKHNFEVTPTFLLKNLNSLIEDRRYWAEHQRTHVEAIQTLSQSVKDMSSEILKLKEIISQLNGNKHL